MWSAHTLVLLFFAGALVVRGLFGKRIGEDPHCRRCNYNLTGLAAERCPECGTAFSERTVALGRWVRGWDFYLSALLVIVIWLTTSDFIYQVRAVYWYGYAPTRFVVRDAEAGDERGIRELLWRIRRGSLSDDQFRTVAKLATTKGKQGLGGPFRYLWSRMLRDLNEGRHLSSQQLEDLYSGYVTTTMNVRSTIRRGDPLIVQLMHSPSPNWLEGASFWHEPSVIFVRGAEVFHEPADGWRMSRPLWNRGFFRWARIVTRGYESRGLAAGQAQVDYAGTDVLLTKGLEQKKDDPAWTRSVELAGSVLVLPEDAPDPIDWIEHPSLEGRLRRSFAVCVGAVCSNRDYEVYNEASVGVASRKGGKANIDMRVSCFPAAPVPFACDVIVEIDGREVRPEIEFQYRQWQFYGRSVLAAAKGQVGSAGLTVTVPAFDEENVHVILRGSREAARRTVDLYATWKGDLRFGPFPVKHEEAVEEGTEETVQ
jgi:hypothetical protein